LATSTKELRRPASATVVLQEAVKASLSGTALSISGPLGEAKKDFSKMPVNLSVEDGTVVVKSFRSRKADLAIVNTVRSIVKNMSIGVTKGFTYRLKIVFAHFPISIKTKGNEVHIENFYGERFPRIAKIVGSCKVSVEGDDVVVKGVSVEDVGQTAANIEEATAVRRKDPRVFLDGIYVYQKEHG